MSGHSPGPWRYAETGEWVDVFDRDGARIIRGEPRHTSWAEPNGRLIALAPTLASEHAELVEALRVFARRNHAPTLAEFHAAEDLLTRIDRRQAATR